MLRTLPPSSAAQSTREEGWIVYLPPERMRRYEWAKAVGAMFLMVIFGGWLILQWSNPVMRALAAALLLLTGWFTGKSIVIDWLRMRGRQISLVDGVLRIAGSSPLPLGGGWEGGRLRELPHVQSPLPASPKGEGRYAGVSPILTERVTEVRLADVKQAQWREETEAALGLWLLDAQGNTLAHLDRAFLVNQAEVREFLGWLRQHSAAAFDVRWPETPDL